MGGASGLVGKALQAHFAVSYPEVRVLGEGLEPPSTRRVLR